MERKPMRTASDPNRPHAFQRSHLNSACALCAGRRRNPIHVSLEEVLAHYSGGAR